MTDWGRCSGQSSSAFIRAVKASDLSFSKRWNITQPTSFSFLHHGLQLERPNICVLFADEQDDFVMHHAGQTHHVLPIGVE